MGLSAAERMRKYRLRIKNSDQYQDYLQKEKNRYQKRLETGSLKHVNKMSDRERRSTRRKWRHKKRKQREQQQKMKEDVNCIITPPTSPAELVNDHSESRQKQAGRRISRNNRQKLKRNLEKTEKQLLAAQLKSERYRKRWERQKNRARAKNKNRTAKQKILARREKLFNSVVVMEIRKKMEASKSEKERQMISSIISTKILKKHRIMKLASKCQISWKRLHAYIGKGRRLENWRKPKSNKICENIIRSVVDYFELDINTRVMPGKRDTITRHGVKKQKRLLNDTVKNIHKRYIKEKNGYKLSYTTFCRLRPFWVVEPNCSGRDTCTCKLHANVKFKLDKLFEYKVLSKASVRDICHSICCDIPTKNCMYRECAMCKDKELTTSGEYDEGKQVTVYEWKHRVEERETTKGGDKHMIKVQVTVKEKEQYTLKNLLDETNNIMSGKICRHEFNIRHQFEQIRYIKENLSDKECIIHVDFSENYAGKLAEEVQGMHFGASRNQVSLHTGVVYMAEKHPVSFCTLSASTQHGPCAIWAHLHPVLEGIKRENAALDTVHFVSDGPTTQYRSKKNMFLLHDRVHQVYGFKTATWNFTEAGHGKGAPDGIGGLVKRTADKAVACGSDVSNIKEMHRVLVSANISVDLHIVKTEDIAAIESNIPPVSTIRPIPCLMKVHQAISNAASDVILSRELSCFCVKPNLCSCFNLKQTSINIRKDKDSRVLVQPKPNTDQVVSVNRDNASGIHREGSDISPDVPISTTTLDPVDETSVDMNMIGHWVVVNYDDKPYPGVVQNVDHEGLEVKVLHRIGNNRYFWPLIPDIIWYTFSQVITLIPEPQYVTKRHLQIRQDIWEEISAKYD